MTGEIQETVVLGQRGKRVPLHLPIDASGVDVHGRKFSERTRTLNVSGGGICFVTRKDLQVGSRLVLYIELPFRLRKHFGGRSEYHVRAVVCRLEPAVEGLARVGARFLGEIAG